MKGELRTPTRRTTPVSASPVGGFNSLPSRSPTMPMLHRLRPWLAVLFAASSVSVHALQLLDARDGVSVAAKVSLKEATRIKVETATIVDVCGNVWQDKVNPNGEVWVETDSGKGELYVRPI